MDKIKLAFIAGGVGVIAMALLIAGATGRNSADNFIVKGICENNESGRLDIMAGCYQDLGYKTIRESKLTAKTGIQDITQQALKICSGASETMQHQMECATGVFNSITNSYSEGAPGFEMNDADPLWLCGLQDESFKPTCYGRMARLYSNIYGQDVVRAMDQAALSTEARYHYNVIANIAAWHVSVSRIDAREGEALCQLADKNIKTECIKGMAVGFFQSAEPGQEHIEGLKFCGQFSNEDADICYKKIVPYFRELYSNTQLNDICGELDNKYKDSCLQGI